MEENELKISDEMLENISLENLADLKVEVDELINDLSDIVNDCNVAMNS